MKLCRYSTLGIGTRAKNPLLLKPQLIEEIIEICYYTPIMPTRRLLLLACLLVLLFAPLRGFAADGECHQACRPDGSCNAGLQCIADSCELPNGQDCSAVTEFLTTAQTFISWATWLVGLVMVVLNFVAWLMLSILDHLMDPNYIFGLDQNGNDTALLMMLREIWRFTRDLVNIGFAVALVFGAIMMIITADGSKMKEHMVQFVVAAVLVNFSWFIPRVVFDISQVLTHTIYQVPSLIGENNCVLPPTADGERPRECEIVTSFRFFEQARAVSGTEGWTCPFDGAIVCIQKVPISRAPASVRTSTKVLDGLVVNYARLQWLAEIQPQDVTQQLQTPGLTEFDQITIIAGSIVKLIIVLILHIAIAFPLAAMVAAFFIRIPVIWVTMAFMPLVALGYAFPKLREGDYGELFWKWQEHFLQAVFLPAKVAVPFVIGFILLNAGALLPPPPNFGDLPFLPLFTGVRDLWQFMWMGIALFIIWKYSFQMLKGEKAGFMGQFTERIEGIGSSLGSLATQLPLSVPFLPVPGRGVNEQGQPQRMSIAQALRGIDPRTWSHSITAHGQVDRESVLREMGLRSTRPNEALVGTLRQNVNLTTTINQQLRIAAAEGTEEARTKGLEQAMRDFAGTQRFQPFARMTEREIVESLLAVDPTIAPTPEARKRLQDLVQSRDGGNRPPRR